MADITNTMNASTPINVGSGQIISPGSPESVLLSTGVREAMDLIFPKSATQLLQRGLSFEEDKFLGVKASKENLHPGTTAAPISHVSAITPPCSMSSTYITSTTTTCMAASSEFVTSTYGNGSPALSLSTFVSTYTPLVYPSAFKSQEEAKDSEVESNNIDLQRKNLATARISTSDIEIISSNEALDAESHQKESKRRNSADLSHEFCFVDDSDSEDMMRPITSNVSEKKKKPESDSLLCEINVTLSKPLTGLAKSAGNSDTQSLPPGGSSVISLKDIISNIKTPKSNSRQESLPYDNLNNINNTSHLNSQDSSSSSWMFKNGSITNHLHKNSGITSEVISNISFLSTKENVQNGKGKSKQSLPVIKRRYFNIVKHKNKIRNTFPPCFVIMKKINVSFYKLLNDFCLADNVLPLSVRLKHLSNLCDKGSVACKKKKIVEEMVYKNIFEETILTIDSEDDLVNVRGRSLRKRDKHINYVEPSEDDILDEHSRKRPRMKYKDAAGRSEEESLGKCKKQKLSDTVTVNSDSVTPVTITPPQDSSVKTRVIEKDTTKIIEINKAKIFSTIDKTAVIERPNNKHISAKEIIVYPPTSSSVNNSYCFMVDGREVTSSIPRKSKHTSYSKEKDKSSALVQPSPNNISVLPSNSLPGAFTRHPNSVMLFPSLPLGFQGSVTAKPLIPGAPVSTVTSTSGETQKPPQYCVVKMDGADVLLQLVPSSGVGLPVPMVMSKGKTSFVSPVSLSMSPSQQFGQPLRSTLSVSNCTQAAPTALTSVVTACQGNISSTPLQSLYGIPVIGTSSQNVSSPALPLISSIPASQLTSITTTASIRPLNLTSSGAYLSQNSAAGLPGHEAISSLNSRITSTVTPMTSCSLPKQSLSAIVTSMAAPNTTTVVRSVRVPGPNLRAIAPNQSTSLRSLRIFVPGCSAMGTPGHFATIGSFANSSPLTHLTASSALLPQRKLSSDPELSPEQRAARRRKLEKKYPLPPGVIIKTEPLDSVTKPSCVITAMSGSRSLLSHNVHLLSTSRPGTGIQSIRIITPSMASALSVRNIRGNSNIIYRAASIGGRQTVLVPASFGQMSTKTTTAVTSISLTTSSSFASSSSASLEPITVTAGVATTTTTAVTNTTCTSVTSFTPTVLLLSSKSPSEGNSSPPTHSPIPQLALSENTLTSMPTTTSESATELPTEGISSLQTSVITSCESSVATNAPARSLTAPLNTSCESSSATSILANSIDNPEMSPDKQSSEAVTLENVKAGLEDLRKMIQIQETRGLKGERLEKLKELLHRKEDHYSELQNLTSVSTSIFAAPEVNCDNMGVIVCGDSCQNIINVDGHCGSETDPFIID